MNIAFYLAQFLRGIDLEPLLIFAMVFGIPIVAILTAHQRKMAQIIHGAQNQSNQVNPLVAQELQNLRSEINQLRDQTSRQAIQMDDMRRSLNVSTQQEALAHRVGESING